ncbi:MAG: hypothetical protein EHM80_13705 [Nitrospiraceae bacterium]|nr:MAG: hypothetical protein EHM80_13705 [Nitrospiraceae bacterium]
MIKRVALLMAVALFVAVDVQAGRFGSRGGCANGQCGKPAYYQTDAKVAVQTAQPMKKAVVQASATEPNATVETASAPQTQQVVSQTARRRVFRRSAR